MSTPATTSTDSSTSPAELRAMFGANLKHLCREAPSISALCRDLGINRTQFNRYLSGESFPRPDVLHRICTFFDVDARILLEPVDQIATTSGFAMHHPELAGFLGPDITRIDQELLPDGFYRFIRRSFMDQQKFVEALVYVYRLGDFCFVRGHEAREAMSRVGLPESPRGREFGGFFFRQDRGVAAQVARRGATSGLVHLSASGALAGEPHLDRLHHPHHPGEREQPADDPHRLGTSRPRHGAGAEDRPQCRLSQLSPALGERSGAAAA